MVAVARMAFRPVNGGPAAKITLKMNCCKTKRTSFRNLIWIIDICFNILYIHASMLIFVMILIELFCIVSPLDSIFQIL
ncbi:hypothetical protein RDI58_024421 [Solanum bulbocastanum]|uniref:Uncharacterized protein n=1 Tax=Solanum bulbocastanum TaxID=147425 RepID=A0AAN8Y5M4_SOLBU